jgi:hypothetical protein
MPLTSCPDCSKQNSDKAYACVNCGRPLRAQPEGFAHTILRGGCWLLIIIFIFFVLAIIMFSAGGFGRL